MGESIWAEISAQYIQGPYWSYITLLLTDQDRVSVQQISQWWLVNNTTMYWRPSEKWSQHGKKYMRENFPSSKEQSLNLMAASVKYLATHWPRPSVYILLLQTISFHFLHNFYTRITDCRWNRKKSSVCARALLAHSEGLENPCYPWSSKKICEICVFNIIATSVMV